MAREHSARSCVPYILPNEMRYSISIAKGKLDKKLTRPEQKAETDMLEQEALWHSVELEMPLTHTEIEQLAKSPELQINRLLTYEKSLENLQFAWQLMQKYNAKKTPIGKHELVRLQRNIEPDAAESFGYRSGEARINGHIVRDDPNEVMPHFLMCLNSALAANDVIYAQKETPEFKQLFRYIYFGEGEPQSKRWENLREWAAHPVDLAAYAHTEFERIHPFNDGNGRLGRLLMNGILQRYGYPVVIIPVDERQHYLSQVKIGDEGVAAGLKRSAAFRPFGTYIGSKIERTLEDLLSQN